MPSPPYVYRQLQETPFELSALESQISESEERRQKAYDASRKLQTVLVRAKHAFDSSSPNLQDSHEALNSAVLSIVPETADRKPREANLGNRMEEYVRYMAFRHFIETGQLLAPSALPHIKDEEYLAGACMGLAQTLSRYGMGQATARDEESVQMARNLVDQILEELLQFDFRNGPLRRKYDGTKYQLKTLETLLYELSVTGGGSSCTEPDPKRPKVAESLLPKEELTKLRERMEHRDNLRETLIKKCRDGQKAAKQSIFALHRGDRKKALQLLQQCQDCITQQLLPIVQEEPPLRYGSFANVLEEYVEAKLFYVWLYGLDASAPIETPPSKVLMTMQDFEVSLEPEEYLGGLCDLTGEIGRYAVHRGTARDTKGVMECLHTNASVLTALEMMERLPGGTGKKMDQLRRSVEKLERMLYEISLSEATGRNVSSDMEIVNDVE